MMGYLEGLLRALRPAFTREATFAWFVVALAGVITRQDVYGVSSIVRALSLAPVYYPALLHFFHSGIGVGPRQAIDSQSVACVVGVGDGA
jgi:hypothetical protein